MPSVGAQNIVDLGTQKFKHPVNIHARLAVAELGRVADRGRQISAASPFL
jgi:hypothetical protein